MGAPGYSAALLLGVAAALSLAGCYEDTSATLYEAGEYKGSKDPLLDKLASEELQQQLNTRFEQVQTDRGRRGAMGGQWRILLVLTALAATSACDPIQEPWVTGEQYAQERQRSDEVAEELRQRLRRVQQDR